jgi:hypothetical protein
MIDTEEHEGKTIRSEDSNGVKWPFVLICCLPLLALRLWLLITPPPLFDFITYWGSGHLFLTGAQPYSRPAMLAVERLQGWQYGQPMMTFCPPWAMPFLAIAARFPFRAAQAGWFAISLLLNCFSALGLWKYFGGEARKSWIAIFVSATFFPMGGAELVGQITPLMLASLTAFLLLLRSEQYFVAGIILLGLGFKPHLLYLAALAIILWIVRTRHWTMLGGALLSFGAASVAAFAYNPNSRDYFHRSFDSAIEISCGAGGILRSIFGFQHVWLQFLPSALGALWLLYYWTKHRDQWDWRVHLPLVLLVSVGSAPYYWYHDFILVLPAVIALAVRGSYRNFLALVAYLSVQSLIVASFGLSEVWASFASILWIAFYCLANAELKSNGKQAGLGVLTIKPSPEPARR